MSLTGSIIISRVAASMTNTNTIKTAFNSLALGGAFLVFATFLAVTPFAAHAQDEGYFSDDGCCDYGGGYDTSTYTPYDTSTYTPIDTSTYTPIDSYSYSPDAYSYSGSGTSLGLGLGVGFGGSSYYPSYGYGSSYYPSYTTPSYSAPSYTNINTNTNTNINNNTCTGNSCNTMISTYNPVVTTTQPTNIYTQPTYYAPTYTAPVYYPTQNYNYPSCTLNVYPNTISYGQAATLSWSASYVSSGSVSYVGSVRASGSTSVTPSRSMTYVGTFIGLNGQQTTCAATVSVVGYPVSYTGPSVTLTSVPYTGVDLGTKGEIVYWSFLALMLVFATYLVAVKRVQNGIAGRLSLFLFGDEEAVDSFIHSQIHRS